MGVETSFDVYRGAKTGKNGVTYYGVGMVSTVSAPKLLKEAGIVLETPEGGVEAVCYILKKKLAEFDGDVHKALMAYHKRSGGAKRAIAEGKTHDTYSQKVIEIADGLYTAWLEGA